MKTYDIDRLNKEEAKLGLLSKISMLIKKNNKMNKFHVLDVNYNQSSIFFVEINF